MRCVVECGVVFVLRWWCEVCSVGWWCEVCSSVVVVLRL